MIHQQLLHQQTDFHRADIKLYVPVVTLSIENDKRLLEQLKSGLKRIVKWNKYRSQTTVQSNNNNLNYLTDPTFTNVNRLFVLSFARNAQRDHRDSFSKLKYPKLKYPEQINFIGKLEDQNNVATMFFVTEESKETTFEFLQKSVNIL